MDFPTIHTNFWDAVTAVPLVMILTQIIKLKFKPPKALVPTVALVIGLLISIFISHHTIYLLVYLWAGFMDMRRLAHMPP